MPELIERLEWDSAHWGLPTGRALSVASDVAELDAIADEARDRALGLVYLSVPAIDLALAGDAARRPGLTLVDIRLVLSRATAPEPVSSVVRRASSTDLDALQDLAGAAHTNTRFFADARLDRAKAVELYRRWIAQCLDRVDEDVAVAEVDGHLAGYVTVTATEMTARIGLLAVDPSARGKGIGEALVRWAVGRAAEHGCERIVVGTQGGSPVAQRLYQRCGFTTESVDLLCHWWIDDLSTEQVSGPTA